MDFLDELLEQQTRLEKKPGATFDFKNSPFLRMPDGDCTVIGRILCDESKPLVKGGLFNPSRTHKLNGRNFHCPHELVGDKWTNTVGVCPVCDYYRWLWKDSESKSPEEAKMLQNKARDIKPNERYTYNYYVLQILDSNGKIVQENVGTKIYTCGKDQQKLILRGIAGDKKTSTKSLGKVWDLITGRNFKIVKTMTTWADYAGSAFDDVSAICTPDQVATIMGSLHDLTATRVVKSAEELKHELKIHLGLIKDDRQSGFDPSEFQRPAAATQSSVTVTNTVAAPATTTVTESATATATLPTSVATEPVQEEEVLADEDFLEKLKNL